MKKADKNHKPNKIVTTPFFKRSYVIDSKGERITPKFKLIDFKEQGPYVKLITSKGIYVFHKAADKIIFSEECNGLNIRRISSTLYEFSWYNKNEEDLDFFVRVYNDKGNLVHKNISNIAFISNGLIAFESNKRWGFMNKKGKIVINPTWTAVESFNEYGYCVVTFSAGKK